MMPPRLLLALALAALWLPALPSTAQTPPSWIGQKVVTKLHTTMMIGDQLVPSHNYFLVYTVDKVNGDWLWLVSSSRQGWVRSADVILFDQALDYYTKEVTENPRASWAFRERGLIWNEKKKFDFAILDYNEAIKIDPEDATSYNNRGLAWSNRKDFEKAFADYNEAIKLDPKDPLPFYNRGIYWARKKDYDKAIADYNEAIRLDPKYTMAYYNRGNVHLKMHEYDEALADYNEAIRLDPKLALAYNNRAWLWATCPDAKHRDGKRAVESATRACELTDWKDAYDLGTLAASYAAASNFPRAIHWQQKANTLYTDPEAQKKGTELLTLYQNKTPYREEVK